MTNCPVCGTKAVEGAAFCSSCGARVDVQMSARPQGAANLQIWYQNFYRIRKKVIAIANQYRVEDRNGNQLGYSRQKIIAIRENIKIFTDDTMTTEVFRIQQEQIMDMWGTFAVIDSATNTCVGKLRREPISSGFYVDEYHLLNANGHRIGKVAERPGRGLLRKYVPGGALVPEQMVVEFYGQPVTEIKQQFKVIGDIWEVDCTRLPPDFDRRTLIACMLLMGMIERDRK